MNRRIPRAVILITAALTLTLTACASAAPSVAGIDVTAQTTIIDVRTSGEYGDGHLEGAVNIDVQTPSFADEIDGLDPAAEYVVYCRSGNRSATAVQAMKDAGFTDVTNAGGLDDAAAATGLPIVTGH